MNDILERKGKWDVDDGFVLPNLDDVVAGGEIDHETVATVCG